MRISATLAGALLPLLLPLAAETHTVVAKQYYNTFSGEHPVLLRVRSRLMWFAVPPQISYDLVPFVARTNMLPLELLPAPRRLVIPSPQGVRVDFRRHPD